MKDRGKKKKCERGREWKSWREYYRNRERERERERVSETERKRERERERKIERGGNICSE